MKPFEIFRTGHHTPLKGASLEFAEQDLATIAAGYDTAKHQAPIVVGHPKVDAPAYGWIDRIDIVGDRLVATPSDVDPAFAELVSSGRFKKVSASFYKPTSPGNPTPGSYALRHVGFLGAQPPAVKGLKAIEFGDAAEDLMTVEFADWTLAETAGAAARIFRRIRDYFVAEKGVEAADELMPSWEIESLERTSIRAEPTPSSFSEPKDTTLTVVDLAAAADLQRRIDALDAREAQFAERQAEIRATEDVAFVAAIVEAGRLPKAQQDLAVALFAELDEDTLSFGEGDGAVTSTPRAAFRTLLSSLPTPVLTGEHVTGKDPEIDFSDPIVTADLITTEIQAAKAEGVEISAATALDRLQKRTTK